MIHEAIGVSKSTMSSWFKDKSFTPNYEAVKRTQYGPLKSGQESHNKRVKEIERLRKKGIEELGLVSKRDLWLLGLGLYIGEGGKTIESVRLVNSDPVVITLAIKWLREICGLSIDNLVISLHLYPDTDEKKAIAYWQLVTGLSRNNFLKSSVDGRMDKKVNKKGKLPHGTVHLRVRSNQDPEKGVKLFRRIEGWVAGALSQY